jgi:hypothetical protein
MNSLDKDVNLLVNKGLDLHQSTALMDVHMEFRSCGGCELADECELKTLYLDLIEIRACSSWSLALAFGISSQKSDRSKHGKGVRM